jgi:sulfur-carrier protein
MLAIMKVSIRYFASLREALGTGEPLDVPTGTTLADVRAILVARGGRHAEVLGPGRAMRAALNQVMVDEQQVVPEGAELAFFPPVTGG